MIPPHGPEPRRDAHDGALSLRGVVLVGLRHASRHVLFYTFALGTPGSRFVLPLRPRVRSGRRTTLLIRLTFRLPERL
jgi:hypothetical protein